MEFKLSSTIFFCAFCQLFLLSNGLLYPKMGKEVGKVRYAMSFKHTKRITEIIAKINSEVFNKDCELALEKIVVTADKNMEPQVDLYIYVISLSRPRMEVLEEVRKEIQNCKMYSLERLYQYCRMKPVKDPEHKNFQFKMMQTPKLLNKSPFVFLPNLKRSERSFEGLLTRNRTSSDFDFDLDEASPGNNTEGYDNASY